MEALGKVLHAVLIACAAASAGSAGSADQSVAKTTPKPPRLDGVLDDACWREATAVRGFTVADSLDVPRKTIQAKVCFDGAAIYLAVVCAEPEPVRIKAAAHQGSADVWRDDCVEIFIRNSPLPDNYYQFIVNSRGVRQSYRRKRGEVVRGWKPEWQAAGKVGAEDYSLEIKIPYAAIERPAPAQGDSVGLKIGREDRVGTATELVTWPGNEGYGRRGAFGTLFFGTSNMIRNADFSEGAGAGWELDGKARQIYLAEKENGESVIHVKTPGGYAPVSQSLKLKPYTAYDFIVEVKGNTILDFRIKTPGVARFPRVTAAPSADYKKYGLTFATEEKAERLLVWGTLGRSPAGEGYVKNMRLVPVSRSRTTIGTVNFIQNADLSKGLKVGWDPNELALRSFSVEKENGESVLHIKAVGGTATLYQVFKLEPNSAYRLSVKVKGDSFADLRLRGTAAGGMQRLRTRPTRDYREYRLDFLTRDNPNPSLAWGTLRRSPKGDIYIKDLRLVQIITAGAARTRGPAIPVKPGEPCRIEKILVKESRVLRGMDLSPVDGSIETRTWNGDVYEYGAGGGYAGVLYNYRNNNGLHVTLADREGVDAIVIRKGAQCKLYRDCPDYDSPEGGALLRDLTGMQDNTRILFAKREMSDRFSFFDVTMGFLGNVSFFRVHRGPVKAKPTTWQIAHTQGSVYEIGPNRPGDSAKVGEGKPLNLRSGRLASEMCLDMLGLRFTMKTAAAKVPLTVAMQDPVNPRRELFGADLELRGSGEYAIYLDVYDQIIPAGKNLFLALKFGKDAGLENAAVDLHQMPRKEALHEALAYNKLLMLAQFIPLTEPRPWTGMKPTTKNSIAWARDRGGDQLAELFETVAYCRSIAPRDETVRQMHEWLHQVPLRVLSNLPEPKIERTPGAPQWADVLRQTWLALRSVPEWWVENRLVPTGEFGGCINDDTCMYQNWVDFPMYEEGGVGGGLKAGMRDLAELILEKTFGKDTGIPARSTDPLHYAEDGLNHMASMVWLDYGNPFFVEQVLHAARSTEEGLTTIVRGDKRHFKAQRMGGEDLRFERKLGEAGRYHFLAMHPALMAVWYNDNPRAKRMLRQWADSWLEYYGKPGRYARMIDVATGKVTSTYSYLRGPQGSAQIMLAFLMGDGKYARPLQGLSELSSRPAWVRRAMTKCVTSKVIGVNARVKAAAEQAGGFPDFVVNGNRQSLVQDLKKALAEAQYFSQYYTTFEPFTDRLFMQHLTSQIGAAYLGGYCTRNYYANTHAVSWKGFGTDYAAMCLRSRPDGLKFLVYSFADAPVTGRMTVWSLEHGNYKLALGLDDDRDDNMDKIAAERAVELCRGTPVDVTIAPKKVSVIEVTQVEKLPDIRMRADLALCAMQVKREGSAVTGVVHNIGSRPADVIVALVDDKGKVVASKSLGTLAAPLDLHPKKAPFRLDGVPAGAKGWKVVVDPEDRVREIYEGNNRIAIPSPS